VPSLAEIAEIVSSRELRHFVGLKEDLFFEAKRARPYDLDTAKGRYELVKDVSAFANAGGGYLVMGLTTETILAENTDEVAGLDLLRYEDFPAGQIRGVLRELLFPRERDFEIRWVESIESTALGVGYVYVPPQDEARKPYLMGGILVEGQEVGEIIFGMAIRSGSSAEPVSLRTLQGWVNRGRASLEARIANIENGIAILLQNTKSEMARPGKTLKEKFDEIAGNDS
jgi:hypothetical protein